MAKQPSSKQSESKLHHFKSSQVNSSARTALEELFYDFHRDRHQIYIMNFVRGIFFGLGSVLGGTLVLALLVWILSLFSDTWLGPLVNEVVNTVQQSGSN